MLLFSAGDFCCHMRENGVSAAPFGACLQQLFREFIHGLVPLEILRSTSPSPSIASFIQKPLGDLGVFLPRMALLGYLGLQHVLLTVTFLVASFQMCLLTHMEKKSPGL